jgi:cell division protein FtsI/penicillin-binding protein 2
LKFLRWLFVLLSIALFSFHIYWANYASEKNEKFQQLSYKDLRVRRLSESTLRGWILDRSGRIDQPLAYYKRDSGGNIRREYPLDKALAHLFGSIAAIRVSNALCSEFKAARFRKRLRSCVVRRSISKAIRTCD